MSPSRLSSPSKCAFRSRNVILFFSLLAISFAISFPFQSGASATSRSVRRGAPGARGEAASQTANFANTLSVPAAAAAPNATLIYGQPDDGRAVESSSKIQGGPQYDREVADDFELNATITRVVVRGSRGGYNLPPNPVYYGVYVRFYEGAPGTPGALQAEHYMPAGSPGVVFNAAQPNSFDITLPSSFNAAGRHFLSVQPVFGGSETWGVSSGNYPNVRGAAWVKRDRLANEAWTGASIAGRLNDMSFDLYGTLLSAPRIDVVSPNPIPRSGLVRISGAYFGVRADGQLTIDGKPSQYIAHWADNLIVAYVPETSALGDVPVRITSSGATGTATLNVTTRPTDGRIRWRFTVAGDYVPRRAAVGPDGTVYFNDVLGRLYALSPDGGLKWVFQAGLIGAQVPVSVGADGTVYVGGLVPKDPSTPCETDQFLVNVEGIFAVRPDGTQKWLFDKTCDDLLSGPNVGPDGKIHVVTDATGIGAFALNPDGTLAHAPTGRFGVDGAQGTEIVFGPAAPGQAPTQKYFQYESGGLFGYTLQGQRVFLYPTNAVGIAQPVAGRRTGTVYTTPDQQTAGRFFAVSPQGALRWVSPIRPVSSLSIPDAPPSESAVYVVQDGAKLHRVNPEDGSVVWTFIDNYDQLFDPVASPDDRLVLMGGRATYNQPGFFEAVSSAGSRLWKQHLPNEPGLDPYGQVRASNRARFTADGQTAYIAADVSGDNPTVTNPVYSFFYALDTSDNNASINLPPKATVTSPLPNSNIPVRTEINLTAQVEDDGQIARVDFYYNRNGIQTFLGSDTTPDAGGNYGVKFTPAESGVYGLFAAAYDVGGLRSDSPLVTITVSSQLPAVSWVSPADGSAFAAPASITLVARATDSDGTVGRIEFKSYQAGVIGSSVLGSDATPDAHGNYQIEWMNPPQGTHELTASAVDNSGLSQNAVITVTVGPASTPVYTIGGMVRDPGGSPLSGVTVTLSNSVSATALTGADGSYLFSDLRGGSNYSVTSSKAGYLFSPSQHVFNGLGANQIADFTGTRAAYAVSGQVKDNNNVALGGVLVTLSGSQAATTTTGANGTYSFPSVATGGSYTITPTRVNYTFAPVNVTFSNLSADQTANFTGTLNMHGLSGRITETGNGLSGVTITLTGSQTGAATTDAGGNYSFNLPAGGSYTITPTRSGYAFTPASLTFSDLSGNKSGSFSATSTNQPPQVTLTSPVNGATFNAPATLTISASANDPDGAISKVEFFAEYATGPFKFQVINLGADTTAPYGTTWSYSGADSFNLRAVATDDRGTWKNSEPVFVTFTLDEPSQTPGWQKQFAATRPERNGAPYETLGFSAVDGQHAWASHINATVSHTTDGGLTWNTVEVPIDGGNNNHAQDVDFVDTQIGWVVGGEDNAALRSTDGGRTFVRQPTGLPASLFGVDAVDANTVFVVGHTYATADGSGPIVLRTRDGGATWTEISHPFRQHTRSSFYAVHFINQTTGWVVGGSGNAIKTTNGGATWTDVSIPTVLPLSDVSFADANHGWVVGYNGTIFRTTDGGATWQQQNAGTSDAILSVSAVSPTVAWIGCSGFSGFVARTTDGGVTWQREYPDVNPNGITGGGTAYSAVLFLNAESGWAAGYSGIYRRGAAQTEPVTYSISGRVTNAQGAGMQGVTVTLVGSQSATIQTSVDGSYSFTGLPGGNYTVTPGMNFFSFTPSTATFNNLGSNQTADFVGAPTVVTITGRVRDASGNGIDGASVTLTGAQSASVLTDANGQYVLRNIVSGGNHTVTATKDGFTFNPPSVFFAGPSVDQVADFVAVPNTAIVQFGPASFVESEGGGRIKLTVVRSGNMSGTVTVAYATTDHPAAVRCDDNTSMPGMAFARCDYATSVDRITFAPGETSASLIVPLVDDSHQENNEAVEVVLSAPTGATLGDRRTARFTITDNDAPNAPNALDGNEFFVRQQYLDFLNREPDEEGLAAWRRVLDNCVNADPACDRNTVSSSFFRSTEFQLKGNFVYLFYKVALNRLPQYAEITPDMRSVSGQSEADVYRKRAEFAAQFVGRAAFREQYDALSDQAFVNTLLNRYNLTAITTRDPANPDAAAQKLTLTGAQLVTALTSRTLTRGQVLRAIVESDEVGAVEYNGAFVAMQYFGYLRRDPDADGFNAWLRVLDANPQDYRTMVRGFESSVEYRLRFGQP